MAKSRLSLTVDHDLVELAKGSGINLSAEFEQWIKIRLNKQLEPDKIARDFNLEKSKLLQDLRLLESQEEMTQRQEQTQKESDMVIGSYIENVKEFPPKTEDEWNVRYDGLIYILKKKLKKEITRAEAKKLIEGE